MQVRSSEKEELKTRVEAKRLELLNRMQRLKDDASQSSKSTAEEMQQQLDDLQAYLANGWDNLTEETAGLLNQWLRK